MSTKLSGVVSAFAQ